MNQKRKMDNKQFLDKLSKLDSSEDHALNELAEELHSYEKKYKMRSEVFMRIIADTPAEDTVDFLSWKSCYQSYFRLFQSKFSLEGITADVV